MPKLLFDVDNVFAAAGATRCGGEENRGVFCFLQNAQEGFTLPARAQKVKHPRSATVRGRLR